MRAQACALHWRPRGARSEDSGRPGDLATGRGPGTPGPTANPGLSYSGARAGMARVFPAMRYRSFWLAYR